MKFEQDWGQAKYFYIHSVVKLFSYNWERHIPYTDQQRFYKINKYVKSHKYTHILNI